MKLKQLLKTVCAVLLIGCGSDAPNPTASLLTDEPSFEEEERRRAGLEALRIVRSNGQVVELNDSSLLFAGYCAPENDCPEQGVPPTGCTSPCEMKRRLCVADAMAAVAGATPVPLEYSNTCPSALCTSGLPAGTYRVPPQSTFTNVNLLRSALGGYSYVLWLSSQNLGKQNGQCLPGVWSAARLSAIVDSFGRAYRGLLDQLEPYRAASLAAADAELSSTPSDTLGRSRRDHYRDSYVRHLNKVRMPFDPARQQVTLGGQFSNGFCGSPELDGPGQTALAVLREAGVAPSAVLDPSISTTQLLEGGIGSGSVRRRLGAVWGTQGLADNVTIPQFYDVRVSDFDSARQYLKEELVAFSRSSTASLVTLQHPDGSSYPKYAATAIPPTERDPTYWAAIARFDRYRDRGPATRATVAGTGYPLLSGVNNPEPVTGAMPLTDGSAIADMLDWAQTYAKYVEPRITSLSNATLRNQLLSQLRRISEDKVRTGRLTYCVSPGWGNTAWFVAQNFQAADGLVLVAGEDQLQCATTGGVEGVPCTLSITGRFTQNLSGGDPGFTRSVSAGFLARQPEHVIDQQSEWAPFNGARPWAAANAPPFVMPQRWYLLKPKRPGAANPGAGDYEALLGFVPDNAALGSSSPQVCIDHPIVPLVTDEVARAMAASREWCSAKAESCAGTKFDERLPLEDELSSDDNDVESSWRHYLELAKAAAAEADALGDRYLDTGIANLEATAIREEKAGAELEKLQEICGTAVDVPLLRQVLLQGGSQDWLAVAASEPRLRPLYECVASFESARDVVHLGNEDLCIWHQDGRLCGGDHPGFRCPDVRYDGVCRYPEGVTGGVIPADKGLKFLETRSYVTPPRVEALCDQLRGVRARPGSNSALLETLRNDNLFAPTELEKLRERISFRARYGGFGAIIVNGGAQEYASGSDGNMSNRWPCAPSGKACDAAHSGLFCFNSDASVSCSSFDGRRAATERLFRAAVAAQYITAGADSKQLANFMPTYLRAVRPIGRVGPETFFTFSVPVDRYSNDTWHQFLVSEGLEEGNARLAHFLGAGAGGWWDVEGATGAWGTDRFAFRRTAIGKHGFGHRARFFDGLWASSGRGGYLEQTLRGVGRINDHPLQGVELSVGAGGWRVSRECSDSCWASPLCDCGEQERDRVRESLRERELEPWGGVRNNEWVYHGIDVNLTLTGNDVLDGLELLCEIASDEEQSGGCPSAPPRLESVADLPILSRYLKCLGDDIQHKGATVLFQNFPEAAVGPLLSQAGGGVFETEAGEVGAAISTLRQALMRVALVQPLIGGEIRKFGATLDELRAAMKSFAIGDQMLDVRFQAESAQRTADCLQSVAAASSVADETINNGTSAMEAAVVCVNSLAQIGFADQLRRLGRDENQAAREQAIASFNGQFAQYTTTLQQQAVELSSAMESVRASLGTIATLRNRAARSVNAALWHLGRDSTPGQVAQLLDARQETVYRRYLAAHANAKRMAFLAKKAIEQRLGMRLRDMKEDMPLVNAPQTWEATVCATTGIDLSGAGTTHFADSYIGDYVRRLENVVESYRLVHNFQSGKDFLVASLRDDILGVRRECELESPNLLHFSGELDRHYAGWEREGAWSVLNCPDADGALVAGCLDVEKLTEAPFVASSELVHLRGYQLSFGEDDATDRGLWQPVQLREGVYMFSWYSPPADPGGNSGKAQLEDGSEPELLQLEPGSDAVRTIVGGLWDRHYFAFRVPAQQVVRVGFSSGSGAAQLRVAAPMLVSVLPVDVNASLEPPAYQDTGETRLVRSRACEDTDGSTFREQYWRRACVFECPDGYSTTCESVAVRRCYRETSFSLSQRGLARGLPFRNAGFAQSNFNYRIGTVGLNFVGTGVQSCEGSSTPAACYANGFVQYSLYHQGPFAVRNHFGQDFRVHLFPGRVERARGLATERYLGNPLGSADRDLMSQYDRTELLGRPMDGRFVLRVWEDAGIDFERIEDVQLLLNYYYWTRFN